MVVEKSLAFASTGHTREKELLKSRGMRERWKAKTEKVEGKDGEVGGKGI